MTALNKHAELRKELLNPAIGSKDHLRKLALSLLDEVEVATDACNGWQAMYAEADEKLRAAEKRIAELEARETKLPRMAAIYWHLSDASKRRTSEENILDVLEAIDSFRAAGIGVKGE